MQTTCPNCRTQIPVVLQQADGYSAAAGVDVEPPGTRNRDAEFPIRLVKGHSVTPEPTLEQQVQALRRELLEAHKQHVAASELAEYARKAFSSAQHLVVEKLGRITQLRNQLTACVEGVAREEIVG